MSSLRLLLALLFFACPVQALQLARFKGEGWDRFGEVLSAEAS